METREYASAEVALAVAKNAVYLAWKACGGPMGMGILQDKGEQDKEAVWLSAYTKADYPGGREFHHLVDGHVSCDYVFGRMMKFNFRVKGNILEIPDSALRGDYQSWCEKYPTYAALFDAAAE